MRLSIKQRNQLISKKVTLSIAESCTGGLLSDTLTNTPNSSAFFHMAVIAYDNAAKKSLLKIPPRTIKTHGAVSSQVATLMATHVRRIINTSHGISITGIAGPSGGSQDKPVGTVFIAISTPSRTQCVRFQFNGSRRHIKTQSVNAALNMLFSFLD